MGVKRRSHTEQGRMQIVPGNRDCTLKVLLACEEMKYVQKSQNLKLEVGTKWKTWQGSLRNETVCMLC